MKRLFIIITLCLLCQVIFGQDLLKLTNGKSLFVEIQSVNNDEVVYQKDNRTVTLSIDEVALIEYLEGGVEYYHKESLQTINIENIEAPVYQKGNKVYIPFSSDKVAHRCGALKLRELVSKSDLWQVVDCEEEAHFIMEFVYSERGKDHGYINIKDREGNLIYQTPKVRNSDFVPSHKGEEIAERLFKKYIRHFID